MSGPEPGTPANDAASMLHARFAAFHLVGISVNPAGIITRQTGPDDAVAFLHSDLVHAAGQGPGLHEIWPGFWAGVIEHDEPAGRSAALFASGDGLASPAFASACASCGAASDRIGGLLAESAHYDATSAGAMTEMLRGAAKDHEALREHDVTLGGFTEELTHAYDTIDLLYGVGKSMKQLSQPEVYLGSVCDRLHKTLSYRYLAAWMTDDLKLPKWLRGQLVFAGDLPVETALLGAFGKTLASRAVLSRGFFIGEATPEMRGEGSGQVLVQPLMCKGTVCGVLFAGGKHGPDPDVSSYDIQLVEASAGYIDAFTENVALLDEQHVTFMGTLQALTASIDAKDRYTFGHSERVALMAEQLALALGMSSHEAERVRIAGLVHDVGKIGVPETVLTKPGKLTDEEFGLIKMHPSIGHRILRDIPQLHDVLPAVLHHHERYDGRGYPNNLAGDQIPLIARIMGVADTFDAMSSNRSYRPALPRARVLDEIERCAGTQFDPLIARLVRYVDLSLFDEMFRRHSERLGAAA